MYQYKKNEKVWANIRGSNLPWHKGIVLSRFKNATGNVYNFSTNIGRYGFEVMEKDLQRA